MLILLRRVSITSALIMVFSVSVAHASTIGRPMLNAGLVGYWSMEEGAGNSKTFDRSGNGNNGTLTNMNSTSAWVNSATSSGQALIFNGSSQYVRTNDTTFITSTSDSHSVSAWVYPTDISVTRMIWGYGEVYDNWYTSGLGIEPGGHLNWYNNGNFGAVDSGLTVPLNQWSFVSFSRTANTITFRVNSTQSTVSESSAGQVIAGNPFLIGASSRALTPAGFFVGEIDDVRVYNRTLSQDEMDRIYRLHKSTISSGRDNTGLVGYWPLDEGSGTRAEDHGFNNNTGTFSGAPVWSTGKIGAALNFDGSPSYVDVGNTSNLQLTTGTISAWIKTSDAGSGYSAIFVKSSAYGLFMQNNEFGVYDWSAATWRGSGYTPNDNNWHLLTCTFQSGVANGTLCYSDGILKLTTTITVSSQAASLLIGCNLNTQFFTGKIDDVRVYNRVLSATEVYNLYKGTKETIIDKTNKNRLTNGLVGHWTFDGKDISGVTAYDSTSNANNGTLTNGPVPTIGKIGQALSLDGINDYVDVGQRSSLSLGQNGAPMSACLWVYRRSSGAQQGPIWAEFGYYMRLDSDTTGDVGLWGKAANMTGLLLNTWQHICFTFDGSTGLRSYLNGVENGTNLVGVSSGAANSSLQIGYRLTQNAYMNGLVDDLRIYNRALSADEIKALYTMGR